ncbi:MAG: hypothetical protein L6406_23725 [Desulfobacterales bacterium]|nr:hypothetical protein [Desulfobacterales bacterium]
MANPRASSVVLRGAIRVQQIGEVICHMINGVYGPLLKRILIVLMQNNTDRELLRV